MNSCAYIYCRTPTAESDSVCPRCGHPANPDDLRTPAFFLAAMQALPDLGGPLLDMHQILPAHPRIVPYQLMAMDQLGIHTALLQSAPAQATSLLGNDALADVVAAHPDRFWASQFVDPQTPDAVDQLTAIAQAGHRVIKLLPVTGWQADAPALSPFWERMQALGLVAMVHTGFFTARHKDEEAAAGQFMSSRFADPLYFDTPCRQFPNLRVILCHMGGAMWCENAAQMVTQHEHVWGDVSGFGLFALERLLRNNASMAWDKVFWGNDSPPFAYPLNLALTLHATRDHTHLRRALLHDNGQRFATAYLRD